MASPLKAKDCISQSDLKKILNYNPLDGSFSWITIKKNSNRSKGKITTGHNGRGYLRIFLNGKRYKAHRLAWLYMTGKWPKDQIDHINQIRDDNRFCNLREASNKDNAKNKGIAKNNTSGVSGVSLDKAKKTWSANIAKDNIKIHLGHYVDKFEAICARKSAERKYGYHENHGK